jgi:isopenicillin-N epimerase
MKQHWGLLPDVTFLNHGSFGACPKRVLAYQAALREEMESGPVDFMMRKLPPRLTQVRTQLAEFLGAKATDVVFGTNATAGVSAVTRSLHFAPGDELLTTNHAYGPCRFGLDFVARERGARVVVAEVPFPLRSADEVTAAVLSAVTPRTRFALIDHVTSATGLIFPVQQIVTELQARGVQVMIDGAHAPGMVDVNLEELGADYYAANLHKWLCAPKGAGMLWVPARHQAQVFPLVVGLGYGMPGGPNFQAMFDWPGTFDPSAWLSVGKALEVMAELGGGWRVIRERNAALAREAREILCDALKIDAPAPASMLGSLASVPLPPAPPGAASLYHALLAAGFEVPVAEFPAPPARVLRISAQLYNERAEYERLAVELVRLLRAESAGNGA